ELRFNGLNYLSLKLEGEDLSTIQLEYTETGYLACFVLQGECRLAGKNCNTFIDANYYTCLPIDEPLTLTLGPANRLLFLSIDRERIQGFNINNRRPKKLLSSMNGILSEIQQCTEDCPIQCI